MKVNEILSNGKITLSFEVFPPKTDAQFESVRQATIDVAALKPSYMSVTYGAGGNTRKNTVAIAKGIQDTTGVTTIAHLTCVGATKENIHNTLDEMKAAGIENVLALRGDRPRDFEGDPFVDFHCPTSSYKSNISCIRNQSLWRFLCRRSLLSRGTCGGSK